MKKTLLSLAIALSSYCSYAQTFNPTYSISSSGTANSLIGGYTFAYATSGSPWSGAFMSFGGFGNNYDCQISTDYDLMAEIIYHLEREMEMLGHGIRGTRYGIAVI
ncbi:MAG: hypothetical protein JWQ34_318 [Mucilaginibacter sp.]|uniref:hypothetical protein n=1 Tax=Mucilaginibacter sp. TaxID=1882438 RepID=UPI002616BF61|nr:hypothetical protein [Mucilaginibacter sp.]MDB5002093.1 hypothetical protein [Mucilaginibacter sp.]